MDEEEDEDLDEEEWEDEEDEERNDAPELDFLRFGIPVSKAYEFTWFGAMVVTKPYKFMGFGGIHGPKPYEFIGFRRASLHTALHLLSVHM